jgi:hypothetical protein
MSFSPATSEPNVANVNILNRKSLSLSVKPTICFIKEVMEGQNRQRKNLAHFDWPILGLVQYKQKRYRPYMIVAIGMTMPAVMPMVVAKVFGSISSQKKIENKQKNKNLLKNLPEREEEKKSSSI